MKYAAAIIFAGNAFFIAAMVVGGLIGQMFDSVTGWWGLIPFAGEMGLCFAFAVYVFRQTLKAKFY